MSFFNALNISASGLTAQRLRMDVISENIANATTTRTSTGEPYRRKDILFEEISVITPFTSYLESAINGTAKGGIKVKKILEDNKEGNKVYDPSHPNADADGYVTNSNVNIVSEMVDMISSSRAYEANVTAMTITKSMMTKTLELSR